MAHGPQVMPLTSIQREIVTLLAPGRSQGSYLAGAGATLIDPQSYRYSHDIDYFHDPAHDLQGTFRRDTSTLESAGFTVTIRHSSPTFVAAKVERGAESTQVDWAQDSAWRFMPIMVDAEAGFKLHPIDVATNKVLALAGRDEPRDVVDTVFFHEQTLELGPLVFAAVDKDPGFNPLSLLEMLKRRGRIRPEMLDGLLLATPLSVQELKVRWLAALDSAEAFIQRNTHREIGCLFWSPSAQKFVNPEQYPDAVEHFGRPGGAVPQFSALVQ